MSKYIKISNQSENVSRIALEKLGLSTKRNDPDTIGQFGSGIKYAPIAALRMGLDWIFTGQDDKGQYILKYKVEKEDGIDCIVYDYGDYKKSSSFTVDAGVLSWEDEFQVYREAIANAMDEAKTSGTTWSREIVDEKDIASNLYEFSVYITASPNMMEIYNDHDKYFLENRTPLFENKSGNHKVSFYKPIDRYVHVYHKQVMVYENEDYTSIFDYEIQNLKLNEMRTVADEWSMNYRIAQAICECNDVAIIKQFIKSANTDKNYFEFECSGSLHDVDRNWKDAWIDLYDEDCIMVTPEESLNQAYVSFIKEKGLDFKTISSSFFFWILKKAGVQTVEDIASESINYEIDSDIYNYPKLIKAIEIAARFEPGLLQLEKPIACFVPKQKDHYLGVVINPNTKDKQILIDKNHALNGELNELVATVVHEYDHYETGYSDGDLVGRKFRDLADRRIGKLMTEFYKPQLIELVDDKIIIDVKNIADLGGINYSIVSVKEINSKFMTIGNCVFKVVIDGDNYQENGCAEVSASGKVFTIALPGIISIDRLD
jgi:hypothetical protein